MLSFEPDSEQKMLLEAISRFAETRIRKVYRDADEDGVIGEDIVQAGWEFGLLPTGIPEAYGGFGEYSAVTGALAMEAFAYGDLAVSLSVSAPASVAVPLASTASRVCSKEAYLPLFCEQTPPKLTAALTEPFVQFDPRSLATTAVLDGDTYVLNGTKSVVPMADESETFLVYANEDGKTQAFLVPSDAAGLEIGEREKLMGIRALATYSLALTHCRVPKSDRVGGDEGLDFEQARGVGGIVVDRP